MSQAPNMFLDPQQYPVRFVQKLPQPIFAFGESTFPLSFSFDGSPRMANFVCATAMQLGTYLTDKDVYNNSVVQLAVGMSQSISLMAAGSDITTASFYLKMSRTDGSIILVPAWSVMEMRQPSFSADIQHSFGSDSSAMSFDPVGGLYPVATMLLTTHRVLSTGITNPAPVGTSKDEETNIVLALANSCGVVDVEVDIVVSWYSDEARTVPVSGPDVDTPRLGLRLHVSSGSCLSRRVSSGDTCVVSSVYPTSVLRSLGGDSLSLVYWGRGQDGVGLFWGMQDGVEVSSNGLAIQSGLEVASYILENALVDYDVSSVSSSSVSSLNSQSSSSSLLDETSQSSSSGSSLSSPSSKSSSSRSSKSSLSSSKSSGSSPSSISEDSSSSSTEVLVLSSSSISSLSGDSSQSSSSSLIPNQIAQYSFSSTPVGVIQDGSGNGLDLTIPPTSGNLGPPECGSDYGVAGGGLLFSADNTHTDYLQANYSSDWASNRGAISFWVKTSKTTPCVAFCMSNGFTSVKTELAVGLNQPYGAVSAWLKTNGTTIWEGATVGGLVVNGTWTQVVVTQNGQWPRLYVNGALKAVTFSTSTDLTAWTSELAIASSPPDRIVVGSAPRYNTPFMSLGFSGYFDELSVWDEALSASDVSTFYSEKQ